MKLLTLLACCAAGAATVQAQISLQLIDRLVTGISADGTVAVGDSNSGGFRYNRTTGSYDALPFSPYGVSGNGSLVVGIERTNWSVQQWSNGILSPVGGVPAQVGSLVLASDAYRISGYTLYSSTGAFVSNGVTPTLIPVMNGEPKGISADGSKVVGWSLDGSFLYENGVASDIVPADFRANGITDDGSVIFGNSSGQGAFIGPNGLQLIPQTPDEPAFSPMQPLTASNGGRVIAGNYNNVPETGAFVWTAELGTRSLSALFDEPEGWFFAHVFDISADGDVLVGQMWNADGSDSRGFILSGFNSFQPVPEPATYGILGVMLLAGTVAWRRRRSAAVKVG